MPKNLIKLKQLDNSEISGYILQVTSGSPLKVGRDLDVSGTLRVTGNAWVASGLDVTTGLTVKNGPITLSGKIVNASSGNFDIGSSSKPFRGLYLSSGVDINDNELKVITSGSYKLLTLNDNLIRSVLPDFSTE